MCHLFHHICSDCYYAAPVWEPIHQTLILKLWRRTDLVHTIDELLINFKIPTLTERRPLLKLSYIFSRCKINGSFLFPNTSLTLHQTPEKLRISVVIFRDHFHKQMHSYIFSTCYLLIWNNFTPLIVIIIIGAL